MGKKITILLLTLMVLAGLCGGYVVGGLQSYTRFQQNALASQEHCGGRAPVHICVRVPDAIFSAFYPSYLAAGSPLFFVKYSSTTPMTLVLSVNIPAFTQSLVQTVNATPTQQSMGFIPPLLSGQVLRKLTLEENTTLHVRVTDTLSHLYYDDGSPLLLHSRLLMQWIAANRLRIAAWVTPDDPTISKLVLKAAQRLSSEPVPAPAAMIGYNKASQRAVRDQVDALFDAMRLDYGIRYVQESVPYSGPGDSSGATQIIKLPADVLQQQSGMCVELTALLASAVESIGLHAEIVIIPGHAFLGVAVTPDKRHFEYWDAVEVNDKVAGDSANLWADVEYARNAQQHKIVDTISISDARNAAIGPMV